MTDDVPAVEPLGQYVVLPVDRMATLSLQGTTSHIFENARMKREGASVCTARKDAEDAGNHQLGSVAPNTSRRNLTVLPKIGCGMTFKCLN